MATNLDLINAAATRTGADAITSLDQGGRIADIANQNYESIVLSELSAYRWKWATKFSVLTVLDEGDPILPWLYAYELPTNMLSLRTVTVGGSPIPYRLMGSKVFANSGADDEVLAEHLWRPPESAWPAWFSEPITRRLEAVFLRADERPSEAADRDAAADGTGRFEGKSGTFSAARKMDAQSDTPRDPYHYPILEARRA